MRFAVVLLALIATTAFAQRAPGWDEGVAAFTQVDAYQRPADDAVWTDMRPLPFKGTDEELQAANGAALYAGPAPGTLSFETWYERIASSGPVNCVVIDQNGCIAFFDSEDERPAFLLPFGVRGTPGFLMHRVEQFRLSRQQAAALQEFDVRGLVLGDGNALHSTSDDIRLLSTHPDDATCDAPGVHCGVVFEVEVTDYALRLLLF
ncbi:MAG: hypothetical protein HKN04_09165 [Rhodothermaceae bacterium]|nr:hypothetical protein [Rhodothermaceae bacterium]